MLTFAATQRIYLAVEPVDMRKSFNGLWALAAERLRVIRSAGRCLSLRTRIGTA